ncbi:alpha/beta hydrolase [Pseudenhygromyxa sp. WMMC2535]|uniref:esterase/lipase family protein n=1 Tax=Pseudenhygromyxa sp. WMMC2535 TaxID=2712867 RepID=UPI0015531022|nr:alpha/beta hydrolase [Pseudenhygromyxa sp. WMMC2535]NVB43314.1 alpha/beta hydrolase [Pseudenhygromyxa sp. WMMC2535]
MSTTSSTKRGLSGLTGLATASLLALSACAGGSGDEGDDEIGTSGAMTETDAGDETATSDAESTDTATTDAGSETDTGSEDACQNGVVPNLTQEAVYESAENGWASAERWRIDSPEIPEDPFFPDERSEQADQQLEFFDLDPTPGPDEIVLQYAPGWGSLDATPVLLVHGADDPPDRAYANPNLLGAYGCGDATCPDEGLMQALVNAGIPVAALVFPNKQGDNYMWIEQIEAAVQVIREQTCADKVDVIGWSKGAFAARMYATGMHDDWGEGHGEDVRKLILIGGPNLGFDYLFRYGSGNNLSVWPPGTAHGPTPHHEQIINFQTVDRSEYAVYETAGGYYFRGQAQMQSMWVDDYPLPLFANSGLGPYAVVDSLSTYWGEDAYAGTTAVGKGIEFTIDQGSVVEEMVEMGIPDTIQTYLLCGEVQSALDYMVGFPNEISGPSDGVVFVDSCAAPDGIGQLGEAAVLEGVNHLELGWEPTALETMIGWLQQ